MTSLEELFKEDFTALQQKWMERSDPDLRMAIAPYVNKLSEMQDVYEVKDFLVAEGIKATMGNSSYCAVAAYVKEATGENVSATYGAVQCSKEDRNVYLPISPVLKEFMMKFDTGHYPELVAA
jgi:hypothetical protein